MHCTLRIKYLLPIDQACDCKISGMVNSYFYGTLFPVEQTEKPDLFYSIPWSHGTLGFLVSAKIKIIPAKKYLKMEYFPAHSKQKMLERFEQETKRDSGNEFVECLVYSEESGVIMTGNQTDDAESDKVNSSFFIQF